MAFWMYSNQTVLNNERKAADFSEYNSLTASQAWVIFIKDKLRPYYDS